MMKELQFFLLLCLLVQIVNVKEYNLLVQIKHGTVRGYVRKTWAGRSFLAFQGIPYAEPPVGKRRFQPPVPVNPWKGVLNATKSHAYCPQTDVFIDDSTMFGDEDCLFLNVYTPNIANLPVIVFIHGGGFTSDSANPELYGPDILLDKDVVLVTINYRLGALGFLSLEDFVLPGNNGLKDQYLAIKWVKDNIDRFGGDPEKITIFGNSAGGASVYYHILSSLTKGLFHAAVSSSGIATSSWALAKRGEAKAQAVKLAKFFNCSTSSSQLIVKCLQHVNAYDIVQHVYKYMEFHNEYSIPYRPVIEPKLPGAFISDHPIDIIKSGQFSQVPYITGITKDDGCFKSAGSVIFSLHYVNNFRIYSHGGDLLEELSGAIYSNDTLVERLNRNFDDIAPLLFYYNKHSAKQKISRSIRKFYFQEKAIDNNTKHELTDVFTDQLFYFPQRATMELHSKYSSKPVYFYLFGYKGTESISKYFGDPTYEYGVCHCDDLTYSFSNEFFDNYKPTQNDLNMNNLITTLLYNFANTGNPTPVLDSLITAKWKSLQQNKFKYYSILGPSKMKTDTNLFEKRYQFWKTVPPFS